MTLYDFIKHFEGSEFLVLTKHNIVLIEKKNIKDEYMIDFKRIRTNGFGIRTYYGKEYIGIKINKDWTSEHIEYLLCGEQLP